MNAKLSVITVTFNAEKYLEQTILSVVNQKYSNIEYIIIDGGSTDNTVDIIKKHETKIAYWVSEKDKGVYDAMNKALEVITGDWVYFLGAGDILFNLLDKVAEKFVDKKIIYYGNVYRNDLLSIHNGKISPFRFSYENICHQSIFYPIDAIKKYRFDLRYKICADHDCNMKLYGDKNYTFKYLPIIICNYDGDGFSHNNYDFPWFKDRMGIIKKNFPLIVYIYANIRYKIADLLGKHNYNQ